MSQNKIKAILGESCLPVGAKLSRNAESRKDFSMAR